MYQTKKQKDIRCNLSNPVCGSLHSPYVLLFFCLIIIPGESFRPPIGQGLHFRLLRGCLLCRSLSGRSSLLLRLAGTESRQILRLDRRFLGVPLHHGRLFRSHFGNKEYRNHAQYDHGSRQSPSQFFNHIRRLAHTHNLIGSGEARSETSTFGLLDEYNQTHQNGKNDDENNQYCVHVYDFLFLLFIINFSKKRIWSAK